MTGAFSLTACDDTPVKAGKLTVQHVTQLIPSRVEQRESWATDIFDIMQTLNIERNTVNVCSIIAVVDQESNFAADPVVAGLGEKSLKEINARLEDKLGSRLATVFRNMLKTKPSVQDNFLNRIRKVKTERQLDELYREIFDYFSKEYNVSALTGAAKIVGSDFSERLNPITTLGSMQVHISYAKENKRASMSSSELRRDLYSQYGGLYYGIHRLMTYTANYKKPLYRFADYNSGMYSSRNAAFQQMLAKISGKNVELDGDLLLYAKDGDVRSEKSGTEKLVNELFSRKNIQITARQVRFDLRREKTKSFEDTDTYKTMVRLYSDKTGKRPPYAIMPEVVISGPKLSKNYNTNWFATRVDARYQTCMSKAKQIRL
ncbi:MAG: DUF1615 family protein [Acinetobacter sp.]|nr:DUF1615 family protein [Acinetobacter sp.]